LSAGKIWHFVPARTSVPDAVPRGGGAAVVLTGVGFSGGVGVGFALADLFGAGVPEAFADALTDADADVDADGAEADALELPALGAGALETALEAAALETAGTLEEATPLALPGALERVPSGAAWW
jgi:hypothetical protein